METDVQMEFVKSLRAFTDFIEERGADLPLDSYDTEITVRGFMYEDTEYDYETGETTVTKSVKEKMREAAKALGKADKVWSDNYLDLRRDFGTITLEFTATRAAVCKRVVVDTIEVPEKTHVSPAHTKEVVEWVCEDAILNT